MPGLDYFGISEELVFILRNDPDLAEVNILDPEEEVTYVEGLIVATYLLRRQAPPDQQTLDAGTSTRYNLHFTLVCIGHSYDGMPEAARARDALIAKVEVVLMKNRTIHDKVIYSYLEGGEFHNPETAEQHGFASVGEINLVANARSTTT